MDKKPNPYAGHRYPPEIISHAVWLYFRFTFDNLTVPFDSEMV